MVFCGPHLPLAFQFVCGPGGGGAANKLEGKWKVSLCLVAPPQADAGYSTNSSFCWRTTFEDICQPLGTVQSEMVANSISNRSVGVRDALGMSVSDYRYVFFN